jgi:PH domain
MHRKVIKNFFYFINFYTVIVLKCTMSLFIFKFRPVTDSDRRFCFEVISPTKSHVLQADTQNDYQLWIQALQSEIGNAIQNNSRYSSNMCASSSNISSLASSAPNVNKGSEKKINWKQMLLIPGNMRCADCSNAGIFKKIKSFENFPALM